MFTAITLFLTLALLGETTPESHSAPAAKFPAQEAKPRPWFDWQPMPALPVSSFGASEGFFVGELPQGLVVAGGANRRPASKNGSNASGAVLSDEIFLLPKRSNEWRAIGRLPHRMAYGAAVVHDGSLYLIGGRNDSGPHAEVWELRVESNVKGEPRATLKARASLPVANENPAAAAMGDSLFVIAGRNDAGSQPDFWNLDLTENVGHSWSPLPSPPAGAQDQSLLLAQRNGDRAILYWIGASQAKGRSDHPVDGRPMYGFIPNANSGLGEGAWIPRASMPTFNEPSTTSDADWITGAAHGQSHLFVFTGTAPKPAETNPSSDSPVAWAYHAVTDTWVPTEAFPDLRSLRSKPVAVHWKNGVAILASELNETSDGTLAGLAGMVGTLTPIACHFTTLDYVMVAGYMLALAAIGIVCSTKSHSTGDFFLGGRSIPWWAAGLSLVATQVSAVGVMAIPAKAFATDWVYLTGIATWFLVVPVITRFCIPFFHRLEVTSAYEYLEIRFNLTLRLIGSLTYCFMQLGRMAVVLYLPALALSAVTGIDVVSAVIAMGLIGTIYTVTGGMQAVIWTDVVQAGVLIGGILLCFVVVGTQLDGGGAEFWSVARAHDKFRLVSSSSLPWDSALWVVLVGNVFIRLSNLVSDQAVVQRYLTTKSVGQASMALWTDVAVSIPWALLVFALGTALFVYYHTHPGELHPSVEIDGIVPYFVAKQLPAGLSGIVVAAIMAASMSSMDSSLHSLATLWVTDFYARFFPRASETRRLWMARGATILLGIFGTATALLLASAGIRSLWDFFQSLIGLFVGSLAGLFLLGMFSRRANAHGALAGALASGMTLFAIQQYSSLHFLLYSAIGVVLCFGVGYLVSLFIRGPGQTAGLTIFTLDTFSPTGAAPLPVNVPPMETPLP